MEIEIITTKKKITKSIVKQLETANLCDLNHLVNVIKIGFYLRDIYSNKKEIVGIFESINGWRKINLREWGVVSNRPFANSLSYKGTGFLVKKFDSLDSRDEWIEIYNKAKQVMYKNHLII